MQRDTGFQTPFPPLTYFLTAWVAGLMSPVWWPPEWLLPAGWLLLVLFFLSHRLARRYSKIYLLFILTGILAAWTWGNFYRQLRQPVTPSVSAGEPPHVLYFRVHEALKSGSTSKRYYVRILRKDSMQVREKALLYAPDSLIPGRTYLAVTGGGETVPLPRPYHPYAFDFGRYLRLKGISYRIFIKDTGRIHVQKSISFITYYPYIWRERIKGIFQKHLSPENYRVATALLLGDRRELTEDLREAFIDAGVVHILAISGMHIGILLFFLRGLFSPLRIRRKWLYHTLILGILWFYAALTGFSPSVLRAVIMFGFFQLAWEGEREVSSLYILLLAAVVILLIDPLMIRNVGFQLSFAAVASIILFYPLFKRLYYPSSWWGRYVTDLTYVSLAAQVGVVPLVLYYFHRFSFGFLLSNLVVIPLLTVVLGLGFTAIALILLHIPAGWLLDILDPVLGWMLLLIQKVSEWQFGVFKEVWFNGYFAWAWLLVSVFLYRVWKDGFKKTSPAAWVALAAALLLMHYGYLQRTYRQSLVLTQYRGHPVLLLHRGTRLTVYADTAVSPGLATQYRKKAGVLHIRYRKFPRFFRYDSLRFRLFSENAVIPGDTFRSDILLLNRSPKIHLDILLNRSRPTTVISAGYNSRFLQKHWQNTLLRRKIPYRHVKDEGFLEW